MTNIVLFFIFICGRILHIREKGILRKKRFVTAFLSYKVQFDELKKKKLIKASTSFYMLLYHAKICRKIKDTFLLWIAIATDRLTNWHFSLQTCHWSCTRYYKYLSCVYIVWIEKSFTRVTDRHHEACRVMPNSDPE